VTNRLPASRQSPDNSYKLLLVVLLVVSQLCSVLHQLDLEHHVAAKECTICLASHALDHGLVPGSLPLTAEAAVEPPGILPAVFLLSRTLVRQVARSPPVSALHA